ncbi:MAG: serine/threonine-protein kinase [Solirubrobacteraceae bacterium]
MDTAPTLPGATAPVAPGAPEGGSGLPDGAPGGRLVLGRYRLARRLGSGGFGAVWLARDERLGREVAVKAVPRARGDAAAGDRAQREALAAARLNHPAVVTLYEAGADEDSHYLISEVVRGRTLADLIATGALSDRDVARIGLAVAGALVQAHERGVIHRDVKPQNVIVPDDPEGPLGVAKLTDFGVARLAGDDPLTRTGDVVGTLAYMAPEQAEGRRVGREADLYALALVLYEAFAGSHPVRGPGPAATARRLGAVLPSLGRSRRDLPRELVHVIDRSLQPRPQDRGSLADLRHALEEALPRLSDEGGTLALPTWPRPRLPGWAGRVSAALAAGLLAGAATTLGPAPPVSRPALAAGVVAAVFLLPRAGWLISAAAAVAWTLVGPGARPGAGLVLVAALAVCPLLLPRAGGLWSVPAAAPLLGLAGLAGAFPALAGQARGLVRRAALGALGAWWLVLAEALLARGLYLGRPPGAWPLHAWSGSVIDSALHAVWPAARGGLALAAVWSLAAVLLPWLIRGRSLAGDLLGATLWATALASGAAAAASVQAVGAAGTPPRGWVAGAVLGGALALAARWLMGPQPPLPRAEPGH